MNFDTRAFMNPHWLTIFSVIFTCLLTVAYWYFVLPLTKAKWASIVTAFSYYEVLAYKKIAQWVAILVITIGFLDFAVALFFGITTQDDPFNSLKKVLQTNYELFPPV